MPGRVRLVIAAGRQRMDLSVEEIIRLPGRHVTDHQMRLFMQFRQTATVATAAAKALFSTATGHRLARDPRLLSITKEPRSRRRPDRRSGRESPVDRAPQRCAGRGRL